MKEEILQEEETVNVVTMTDSEGNETEFVEDIVIPYAGKQFAALVRIPASAEDEEEPDIILARMETDESGEIAYVPPTDEEFDAVSEIYENM